MACKNLVLINNDIKGQAVSAGWRELNELSEEKTLRYSLNDFVFLISFLLCILRSRFFGIFCKHSFICVLRRNKLSLYFEVS